MLTKVIAPLSLVLSLATQANAAPAVISGTVAAPAVTQAAPPRNEVRVDLGVASPVGEGGLTLSRWFSDTVGLEGGVGYGYSGLQLSVMPKLALESDAFAFTAGVGPSLSLPVQAPSGVTTLLWLNAEVGFEYRPRSRWVVAMSAGVAVGLKGRMEGFCLLVDDGGCSPSDITGGVLPTLRFGVGRRF